MQFVTYDQLENSSEKILAKSSKYLVEHASRTDFNTFLSHSSKDIRLLPAVIRILERNGGVVYTDNSDETLPDNPNHETARILRNAIRDCQRFVVFVTARTKSSKWVPWELGLGDGLKTGRSVCIFPASPISYDMDWAQQEYLGLYKRVAWGKLTGMPQPGWVVWDHHLQVGIELDKWISGGFA